MAVRVILSKIKSGSFVHLMHCSFHKAKIDLSVLLSQFAIECNLAIIIMKSKIITHRADKESFQDVIICTSLL